MPRVEHRAELSMLSYETRLVLSVLYEEINALRQQAGLPVRTPQAIRQALREYLKAHPKAVQEGGT